ncbi:Gnt-I system high-affinity gluconate transporter [Dysgonomonas sp. PFB1-18]|uniref:gluconate:H+ symporter n=1 Tax=unclassified Dysgonomonas TaxID=2630389 RepID=UPI0024732E0E|nr:MULTISPECIES: gluconate:H+ symporter [unclassified Dysgonomonas]MDH6308551.1 Gnt-I system high-affinity gluconate transporter [Dysgonomonas sp. PF1-14]MDH6338052.1 Gnt-I system high-affinity gluconate transporter [Dysgonomonas sp. PF1-16]MDH6379549.1 Gnt-I system high-affinity gluconate transporter [Dysgonomonas sp. PFB1-18]MDH6396879.1 Gnt-I system high-affinity gluconate transporter [Dysgonomonas sp. PF1-23]
MSILIIILSLLVLVVLVAYFKVDAFLSFVLVSIGAALCLGIPLSGIPAIINKGIGNIYESIAFIIIMGAMLGKLVAESGAAGRIAEVMIGAFGTKKLQWGMMVTGFIVGIPLFYDIGFVLLVPIIFSIVYKYKLPAVYVGIPMLAALSVAHGFLPPHPSPVALVGMFGAEMGKTLILGLIVAVPAIIVAGPIFSKTLKNIKTGPITLFEQKESDNKFPVPGKVNSFVTATLPVFLLIVTTILPYVFPNADGMLAEVISFVSSPSIVMLLAVIVATYTLGLRQGRSMKQIMDTYVTACKDIAMIILIVAGSGIFKLVMQESGVSDQLAEAMQNIPVHPLILGWFMASVIRLLIGSATVAALTAAGVMMPLLMASGVNPNLMVLAIGAGSLMFSHVNDSGFWLYKEYFNLSMKDTIRSWSVMQTIVSVMGIIGVMIVNLFI